MNAGIFVWVDLLRDLYPKTEDNRGSDQTSPETSPSDAQVYRDRESGLFKRCLYGGVMISSGSSYSTEELGWFRISFAVEEQALHVGLPRLLKCLQELEA